MAGAMMAVIFLATLRPGRGLIAWDAFGPLVLLILAMSYFHAGLYLDAPLRWVGLLLVGGYLFNMMGSAGVTGLNIYSLFVAVVGAVLVLVAYHAVRRVA